MRKAWSRHPLQLYDPTPHHPQYCSPRPGLVGETHPRASIPSPGPSAQGLKPSAWSLKAPFAPLHSTYLLLEPGAVSTVADGMPPCLSMSWV